LEFCFGPTYPKNARAVEFYLLGEARFRQDCRMNILNCTAFRCVVLPSGTLQLELENPRTDDPLGIDPFGTRVLYIEDVAAKLKRDPKTVQRMSRRRKNPLPLKRGAGRPFIIERNLFAYMETQGRPIVSGYL
jgi:hypothetical protein